MLFYVDYENKIIYIMAPKCGTTSIANMLNVHILHYYNRDNINNPEYKKIIIIRKSIIDRFLSGFYQDLFDNECYDKMNITFNDYLLFLYKCHKEKIPNVQNLSIYNGLDIPVTFHKNNITNEHGKFCSHIISQKDAIYRLVNQIKCKNVQLIELNNLSILLPNVKICNAKKKLTFLPNGYENISNILLCDIKKNKIIISENFLNEKQKQIILDIYKEDVDFINELEIKYLQNEKLDYNSNIVLS